MKRKYGSEKEKKRSARRSRVAWQVSKSPHARLIVFRSAKHTYAQLVDATSGRTIGSVSTRSRKVMGEIMSTGNTEAACLVGKAVAELAKEKKIDRVVFHRNGFLYHGRVKALAEAAREAGLRF